MPDPAILSFIQSQRAAGASDETIAGQLRSSGWPESEINAALGGPQPVQAPIYPGYHPNTLNTISSFNPSASMKGFMTQVVIFSLISSVLSFIGRYITGMIFSAFFATAFIGMGAFGMMGGGNPFLPSIGGFLFNCFITVIIWVVVCSFIATQMPTFLSIKQSIPVIGTKQISVFKAFFVPYIISDLIIAPMAMGFVLLIAPIMFIPLAISMVFNIAGDFIFAWGVSRAFVKYFNIYYF